MYTIFGYLKANEIVSEIGLKRLKTQKKPCSIKFSFDTSCFHVSVFRTVLFYKLCFDSTLLSDIDISKLALLPLYLDRQYYEYLLYSMCKCTLAQATVLVSHSTRACFFHAFENVQVQIIFLKHPFLLKLPVDI